MAVERWTNGVAGGDTISFSQEMPFKVHGKSTRILRITWSKKGDQHENYSKHACTVHIVRRWEEDDVKKSYPVFPIWLLKAIN